MSNQFLDRPRRRVWVWLLLGAIGLLALVAIGVAIESAASRHKPENTTPPSPVPFNASSPAATVGPSASASGSPLAVSTEPLTLVQGREYVEAMYVGYPHSQAGAVSAAAEYWTELGSTLDPDRAAAIARLAADPRWTQAAAYLAEGPVNTRKGMDIAASGPVPTGASVQLEPVEYQIRVLTSVSTTVLLLADYTTTSPDQGTATHIGVFPMQLVWTAGDWKIAEPSDQETYSGLAAVPGSAQAAAYGWQELNQ